MTLPRLTLGLRASGEVVRATPSFALVTGNTGSGKTTLMRAYMAGYAQLGGEYQAVVVNPKLVGWADAAPRFHVVTRPELWIQVFIALNGECERRYAEMARRGVDELPPSTEFPHVLAVLDEAPAAIGSSAMLPKREADELRAEVMRFVRMARQASMGLWVVSQTAYTEGVPSGVRSNLHQRVVLRSGSAEEAQAASGRSVDEVPALSLLPGEALAMTDDTSNGYVRFRASARAAARLGEVCRSNATAKMPLPWLAARGVTG